MVAVPILFFVSDKRLTEDIVADDDFVFLRSSDDLYVRCQLQPGRDGEIIKGLEAILVAE